MIIPIEAFGDAIMRFESSIALVPMVHYWRLA